MVLGASKARLVGAAVVGVVVLGTLLVRRALPPTVRQVAIASVDAIQSGDGDAVWKAMSPEERAALGNDRDLVRRVVREYIGPALRDAKPEGEPAGYGSLADGTFTYSRPARTPDGRPLDLTVTAVMTPDGAVVPNLFSNFVVVAWFARHQTGGLSRQQTFLKGVQQDASKLRNLGLQGICMAKHDGLVAWPEVESIFAGYLAREGKARS